MKPATTRLFAPLAVLAGLCAPAHAAVDLTFGLGLRLVSDSNPGLTPFPAGPSTTAGMELSFGLTAETAQSRLALGMAASLDRSTGSGATTTGNGLANPNLTLAYSHTAGMTDFTLDGALKRTNLAAANDFAEFQTGTGTRLTGTLQAGLAFGKTGPLGADLTAGVTNVTYQNAPGQRDSHNLRLGAHGHADLSAVLHLQAGVHTARFVQMGSATRTTPGLDASLTLDRPTGSFVASLTTDQAPEGQRSTLDLSHQLALASGGTLSYNLGATRAASGSTYAVGGLQYDQDLARGAVSLGLNRAVQANVYTDAETVVSQANVGYRQDVTRTGSLALALNWAQQRDTATDLATANTNLSATWTQALTADWALDLGYTHRMRDQDLVGVGQSDTLSLSLHREFSVRY